MASSADGQEASNSNEYEDDALARGLGKRDHRGYVKCAKVGLKKAFGAAKRRKSQSQNEEHLLAKIAALESNIATVNAEMAEWRSMFTTQMGMSQSLIPVASRPPTMGSKTQTHPARPYPSSSANVRMLF